MSLLDSARHEWAGDLSWPGVLASHLEHDEPKHADLAAFLRENEAGLNDLTYSGLVSFLHARALHGPDQERARLLWLRHVATYEQRLAARQTEGEASVAARLKMERDLALAEKVAQKAGDFLVRLLLVAVGM